MEHAAEHMNSRSWWEDYFASRWDANGGTGQTRHFMDRLIANLPAAETAYLRSARAKPLDVLDWGCAFGEGVRRLAAEFPRARVAGLDFAATAIAEARRRYPGQEFILADGAIPREFDVVLTSNCLEHFAEPLAVMSQHLGRCRKLYLALVPYNEYPLCPYHVAQFREESFPARVGEFTRVEVKPVDVDPAVWPGRQLLAVYGSPAYLAERREAEHMEGVPPGEREKWERFYASVPLVEEDLYLKGFGDELVEKLSALLPDGGTTLEAGCGAGWQSLALARTGRFRVSVMDFAPSALDYARRLFGREGVAAQFIQEDVLSGGTGEFDLVLNAGVLEHYTFDQQVEFLRAMARRSRRYVLVLVPNRLCYWYWLWRVQKAGQGEWPYGKEAPLADLSAAFAAAGLRFVGQAFMGAPWTENFVQSLAGIDPALRGLILDVHRSPIIPDAEKGYLLAALGSVADGASFSAPQGWAAAGTGESVDAAQATAAVADALALRVGAEVDLRQARADGRLVRVHADDLRARDAGAADLRQRLDVLDAQSRQSAEQVRRCGATNQQLEQRVAELAAARQAAERQARDRELDLQNQLNGLRLQAEAADQRREAMRAALSREQRARHLLEAQVAGAYRDLVGGVSEIVGAVTPRGATVLVVSKGDPELLRLHGRVAWHFPRGADGGWAGYHPVDGRAAIEHLEAQRAAGGGYFLLPTAAFWWLEHYADFATHLDAEYTRIWDDERCIIYRLAVAGEGRDGGLSEWGRRLVRRVGSLVSPVGRRNGHRPAGTGRGRAAMTSARPVAPAHAPGPATAAVPAGETSSSRPYDVLCFPIVDWDYRFQRPQQLMSRAAAAGHRVFYVAREFRQSGDTYHVREKRPNVLEISLRGPKRDVYRDALDPRAADELLLSIEAACRGLSIETAVAMVQLPFWGPLAARVRGRFGFPIVYDCMDDHAAFSTNSPLMVEQEDDLLKSADLVVVSAAPLAERVRPLNANVLLVRNACDYDHFATVAPVTRKVRPVIGYHGAISEWFDADLVADLAAQRPDWDFVLVGGVAGADVSRLATLPNVEMAGEQPYAQLPGWLARFNVAIIPFKRTPLTEATNPVKAYEALAAGRPVVSVPLPEVVALAPLARVARDAEGFEREIIAALREQDPAAAARRRGFARRNTWQDRYEVLAGAVDKLLPASAAAAPPGNVRRPQTVDAPPGPPAFPAGHVVVFASVPYDDIGGGQRSAQLTRSLLRRRYRVTYLYAYPKMDVTTGTPIPSGVALPGLDHRPVHDATPAGLLSACREDTTFLFELPHPTFLPFAELAWARGLRTVFELIDDWESSLGAAWFDNVIMQRFAAGCAVTAGTARVLVDRLRRAGATDPVYLPNAADETVFDAYRPYSRPADYPDGYARTLLYFGSLYGEWFGWEYVRAAAERNRDAAIVLIGDDPRTESMPPNVISLGPKENGDLPAYLAAADAAIVPFRPCPITDAVSPVKVFEYLFLCKRVVATRMPELDGYPYVRQAATPAEFAALCADLPAGPVDTDRFVSQNSWNARLDVLVARPRPARRFSFVVLIHNNGPIIGRCLRTLIEHMGTVDGEIIVVDNASTDGGDALVAAEFPGVRLVRNPKNGCSTGRNLGAAAATGDCLVFIDSDQWFTSSAWIYEADDVLRNHPLVGALSWNAGWFDPGLDSLGGPTVDHLPNRGRDAAVERYGFRTDVAYLATSGMFVPRAVWERCDGFDPAYDPHVFEDTDLSFQVRRLGLSIAYRDLTGIRHQPHQTTRAGDADEQYVRLFKRNSAYFKNKWSDRIEFFTPAPG